MDTRSIEWEEEKEFTSEQVRSMDLNKYNNLLTLGRWYNKDAKYYQIPALVGVTQKLAYDSNKTSDKSNRE